MIYKTYKTSLVYSFFSNKSRIIFFLQIFLFYLRWWRNVSWRLTVESSPYTWIHQVLTAPSISSTAAECAFVYTKFIYNFRNENREKLWQSLFVSRRLYFLVFGQAINQLGWFPAPGSMRSLPDQALTVSRRRQHPQSLRLMSFHRRVQDQTTFWHSNRKFPTIQGLWEHSIGRHLMNN